MTEPPAIVVRAVRKAFGGSVAVDGADLTVGRGELVALLGPSGSGKTTLLRTIAGFEEPDEGTVTVGGRRMCGDGTWVEPEARQVGMVFQDGALFPHLTVAANVEFGGPAPGRAEESLALVGLAHRGRSYPHELSGGERQRVALARALATDPEVVLLDEPFASLDTGLRVALREEVAAIMRAAGVSALLVTHDQQEALSLADQVVVMRDGRVAQAGGPVEVYHHPRSRWVAEFLGAAEVLPGTAGPDGVTTDLGVLVADGPAHGAVEVIVRPEAIGLGREGADPVPAGAVAGEVVERSFYGPDQLVGLRLAGGRTVRSRRPGRERWDEGEEVRAWVEGDVRAVPPEAPGSPTAPDASEAAEAAAP